MSRSDVSKPRMSDVMPTIDVMPMTTPSTVRAERILFVAQRVERHARDLAEQSGLPVRFFTLFAPQRFDRVEHRGAARRVPPEEQPDHRGDADAEDDRPRLDRAGRGVRLPMMVANKAPEGDPDDAAG